MRDSGVPLRENAKFIRALGEKKDGNGKKKKISAGMF